MIVPVVLVAVVAAVVQGLRWLRVAQREHYIVGSVRTTLWRWVQRRPPNLVLAVALVVALVVLVVIGEGTPAGIAAVIVLAVAAVWPVGLPVVGIPRLKFTRRARTLAGAAAVIWAVILGAVAAVGGWWIAALLAPAVGILAVELALAVTRPLETRLAERHRRTAAAKLARIRPTIVAVTGSWGKTSTKNHIRDLLDGSLSVVASPASWNNQAGLSRAINENLTPDTEVFVAEMGMYQPGEIRRMCDWVTPNVAVVTAVGPMHLERAGSLDAIAEAKAEIVERCEAAVLWVSNDLIRTTVSARVAPGAEHWPVGVGSPPAVAVGVIPEDLDTGPRITFRDEVLWEMPTDRGLHVGNVACAVAACLALGVDADTLRQRLPSLNDVPNRGTSGTSERGVFVIDDTFNSNPIGAHRALERLAEAVPGRKVLVTPGMVELGPMQVEANEAFARRATELGIEVVVVGWTNRTALLAGAGPSALTVARREEAVEWVRANLGADDGVLWENDLPDHYP